MSESQYKFGPQFWGGVWLIAKITFATVFWILLCIAIADLPTQYFFLFMGCIGFGLWAWLTFTYLQSKAREDANQ